MGRMGAPRGCVLVADGSPEGASLLGEILSAEGFEPMLCHTAAGAAAAFARGGHVAVLLEWMLPDAPGIELCRRIRESDDLIPVLFVSGRDAEATIARGLDAGADDYLVRPVRRTELVSRLEAHTRKAAAAARRRPLDGASETVRIGVVEVDSLARSVRVDGVEVSLGPLEFRLLEYFARHAGIAISREQVLNEVYGYEADISTERVDLLVRRLRAKLGDGLRRGGLLVAVPGYGYRLERRRDH